jgi:hypothetical protein
MATTEAVDIPVEESSFELTMDWCTCCKRPKPLSCALINEQSVCAWCIREAAEAVGWIVAKHDD